MINSSAAADDHVEHSGVGDHAAGCRVLVELVPPVRPMLGLRHRKLGDSPHGPTTRQE